MSIVYVDRNTKVAGLLRSDPIGDLQQRVQGITAPKSHIPQAAGLLGAGAAGAGAGALGANMLNDGGAPQLTEEHISTLVEKAKGSATPNIEIGDEHIGKIIEGLRGAGASAPDAASLWANAQAM